MPTVVPRSAADRDSFWSIPRSVPTRAWEATWLRLVDQFINCDSFTLYKAVEDGVPAVVVEYISRALNQPTPEVLVIIGLPETRYRRKLEAGEALPDAAGHRAVALMRVSAKLWQLLAESGDPREVAEFNVDAWVSTWINAPLPELGGSTPAALLRNPDGQRVVETLLERMRGGLAA